MAGAGLIKIGESAAIATHVAVDDLAAMMRLVHEICCFSRELQDSIASTILGLAAILNADAASFYDLSHEHHPLLLTKDVYSHHWTKAHADNVAVQLHGDSGSNRSVTGIIRRSGSQVVGNGDTHHWHYLASSTPVAVHRHLILAFARKENAFSEREVQLLRAYQESPTFRLITRMPETKLPSALTRRLQEVLAALRTGKSEKEIADGLKLSRHTVHVYVKSIYRTFGVNSRAELLSLSIHAAVRQLRTCAEDVQDSTNPTRNVKTVDATNLFR